jgi:hypothetical protein
MLDVTGNRELILSVRVEGGGASVYRIRTSSGDTFYVECDSISLDEDWYSWSEPAVDNLDAALDSIIQNHEWILFYPISVHPEFRDMIWQAVERRSAALAPHRKKRWTDVAPEWQRVCGQPTR